jgi:hypothetical protein
MRRNNTPRRWQIWRRSGAVQQPEHFIELDLTVESAAPHAKGFAIIFVSDDPVVCEAHNKAIRHLMLREDMKPLHIDTTANGDSNSPGKHMWIMQSKYHVKSDLLELLDKIPFEAWVHSPPASMPTHPV